MPVFAEGVDNAIIDHMTTSSTDGQVKFVMTGKTIEITLNFTALFIQLDSEEIFCSIAGKFVDRLDSPTRRALEMIRMMKLAFVFQILVVQRLAGRVRM